MTSPEKRLAKPKAIIFDLDGTLINSAPDIAHAFNKAIGEKGYKPLETQYIEKFIGHGPRRLIHDIFDDLTIPYDTDLVGELLAQYRQNYHANPVQKTEFFPHVQEDLQRLRDSGLALGICTNKPHDLTAIVLQKLAIKDYFQTFYGADAVQHCKPHANHLQTVMQHMGVDCTTTFYVGDTEVDRQCAHAAKTPFFMVPWGGGVHMPPHQDNKINRLSDLLEYF